MSLVLDRLDVQVVVDDVVAGLDPDDPTLDAVDLERVAGFQSSAEFCPALRAAVGEVSVVQLTEACLHAASVNDEAPS